MRDRMLRCSGAIGLARFEVTRKSRIALAAIEEDNIREFWSPVVIKNANPLLRGKGHLYGLDLLRLSAAALVVLNHFGAFSAVVADVGKPFAFPALNFMTMFGWVGVEIFFVISGFVIALSARGASPSGFLKRRALRIFPALWVCSLVSLVALTTTNIPVGELMVSFVHSIILSPRGPYVDGVVWSLIVEAVFYLLIWLVLLSRGFHHLDKVAATLAIASVAFLSIYCLAVVFEHSPWAAGIVSVFERFVFKVFLLRYGVFFALGMTLWLGFEYGFTRNRRILVCFAALFGAVEIGIQAGSDSTQAVFASAIPPFEAIIIPIMVWSVGTMALVASVFYRAEISDVLKPRSALVTKLGLLTFPLYLNHYTLGRVMTYGLISAHLARPAVLAISLGLICGSSWLIMMIPEPAIQAGFRKVLKLGPAAG
jgi:peptidoglycan/LPS O-acetylase OafA/YrhL